MDALEDKARRAAQDITRRLFEGLRRERAEEVAAANAKLDKAKARYLAGRELPEGSS